MKCPDAWELVWLCPPPPTTSTLQYFMRALLGSGRFLKKKVRSSDGAPFAHPVSCLFRLYRVYVL